MEKLNSFLALLKEKYSQQGQAGKILIPSLGLLLFCCLCAFAFNLSSAARRNAPGITPSPILPTREGTQPTPTALFGFDATLFPTLAAPSPLPTTPSPATATPIPTQTAPAPTATSVPASTNTLPPPIAPGAASIQIIGVDKRAEYVEIRNTGPNPMDLTDWKLVSETGNQPCTLWVTILPNETLRIWSRKGDNGVSCGYHINIWNDTRPDPAVLYDAQGREVSRYP